MEALKHYYGITHTNELIAPWNRKWSIVADNPYFQNIGFIDQEFRSSKIKEISIGTVSSGMVDKEKETTITTTPETGVEVLLVRTNA
jgi:hypothetical protein